MKIIKQNCQPEDAYDTSLPYTCYLVSYRDDGVEKYDLVIGNKRVEIFDYYWDLYRHDLITFKQSEGRVNPKLWTDPTAQKKKKTK